MKQEISYLMLGTNLGQKEQNLKNAREQVHKNCGTIIRESRIYRTEPWGYNADEEFLNQIIVISTGLHPHELLNRVLAIEKMLGRIRDNSEKYSSRVIDIDILFHGFQKINSSDLEIPHPRIEQRRFVLVPLLEISSGLRHPVTGKTVWQMYRDCEDELGVEPYSLS